MSLCAHLTVLTELAAEGHGEVGGCTRPAAVAEEVLVVVEGGASAFTDLHILETGLYTVQRQRNEGGKKNIPIKNPCYKKGHQRAQV